MKKRNEINLHNIPFNKHILTGKIIHFDLYEEIYYVEFVPLDTSMIPIVDMLQYEYLVE